MCRDLNQICITTLFKYNIILKLIGSLCYTIPFSNPLQPLSEKKGADTHLSLIFKFVYSSCPFLKLLRAKKDMNFFSRFPSLEMRNFFVSCYFWYPKMHCLFTPAIFSRIYLFDMMHICTYYIINIIHPDINTAFFYGKFILLYIINNGSNIIME